MNATAPVRSAGAERRPHTDRSALLGCLCLSLAVVLMFAPLAESRSLRPDGMLQGAHGNTSLMPKSCRACHRGMNMSISGEERVCLSCHGNAQERDGMIRRGYLDSAARDSLENIETALRKPYSHPVLSGRGAHRSDELLPERGVNVARHAECVDCHNPHLTSAQAPFRGISGKRVGNFVTDIDKEYELCYRCHAESANLPARSTNKHAEFRTTNPSYHPVEGEGANAYVISLKEPYAARKQRPGDISVISCSDCHGNDDPQGPRGPHGSNYRGLLSENYEQGDARPESARAYALCYRCHERSSILGNESFPLHALHIQGRPGTSGTGTSCFTCHDAHGSTRYQYLIRFNEEVVEPAVSGKLEFSARGVASRSGSCTLNCHGREHDRESY